MLHSIYTSRWVHMHESNTSLIHIECQDSGGLLSSQKNPDRSKEVLRIGPRSSVFRKCSKATCTAPLDGAPDRVLETRDVAWVSQGVSGRCREASSWCRRRLETEKQPNTHGLPHYPSPSVFRCLPEINVFHPSIVRSC